MTPIISMDKRPKPHVISIIVRHRIFVLKSFLLAIYVGMMCYTAWIVTSSNNSPSSYQMATKHGCVKGCGMVLSAEIALRLSPSSSDEPKEGVSRERMFTR
jgi:hypothetical protein